MNKIIIASFLLFAACKTTKTTTSSSSTKTTETKTEEANDGLSSKDVEMQSKVEKVKSKFENYSLAEFKEGKTLYETKCNTCHSLKNPTSYSEEKWTAIVPKMVSMSNKKYSTSIINASDEEKMKRYLITMSIK